MDIGQLIPPPDFLQVQWGWFQLLQTGTFFCHLLVMNVMLGAAIISLWYQVATPDSAVAQLTAQKLPFSIAFAVNLGVAPLLFLQVLSGHFIYVSSILMASLWLSVVAVLIISYYAAYIYQLRYEDLAVLRGIPAGVMVAGLLYIAFIFSANMALMENPNAWPEYFARPEGWILNLNDPRLMPRFLHTVLGAVATAGLALALYGDYRQERGHSCPEHMVAGGCRLFSYATIANFGVGFWYLGSLPTGIFRQPGLAGKLMAFCLLLAIATTALAVINGLRERARQALAFLLLTLLAMTLVREFARAILLAPWRDYGEIPLRPEYSPFIFFLLVLGFGVFLVVYMARLVLSGLSGGQR
ncbi:MAG: hypothetical protein ABFR97_03620 [Thermodesulfobacteriota bacterium]